MQEENSYSPFLIIGKLSRDFILTREGETLNDVPGGHLLYAAIGMSPWEKSPGLAARVGKNYPGIFLEKLSENQFNTDGIKILDSELEHRNFISYFEPDSNETSGRARPKSVLSQYFNAGQPFPRELLGFSTGNQKTDSLTEMSRETLIARDIPKSFLEARCIHLCPLDYLSHNLLPQAFYGNVRRTITIQAGSGYMQPFYFRTVKSVVNGLTAFIARERDVRNLFSEQFSINDLRDMMKILLDHGTENVVVKSDDLSYYFINRIDRKIKKLRNESIEKVRKIGALSCFCGAYLVGINETYDYQKAAAYGAARTSLLRNDRNPYSNLNVLDTLLKEKIRIMENMIEG